MGLVPLVLTGWFLSDKSGKELRAVENRYQTQLVQEKANQLEIIAQSYRDLVGSYAKAIELNDDLAIISTPKTEEKFSQTLKDNPNVVALYVKPLQGESLSVFRSESVQKSEIENFAASNLTNLNDQKFVFGQPQKIESSGEIVFTISSPVIIENQLSAAVMAVVSVREIARVMETQPMSEAQLWEFGFADGFCR